MDMYSCDTIPVAIGECSNIVDIGLSQADVLCVDKEGVCYYWGERVHLEPHVINDERFIDENGDNQPNGKGQEDEHDLNAGDNGQEHGDLNVDLELVFFVAVVGGSR